MHFTWSHFLVKFYSGTILMVRLLDLRSDITVSAKPPCLFWVQVAGLRVSGNPGTWSQAAFQSPCCYPPGYVDTEAGERINNFLCSFQKMGKSVLPESAASAREKELLVLHQES